MALWPLSSLWGKLLVEQHRLMIVNKRVFNTVIGIIISLMLAFANMAGLHYIDKSIGPGNVQVMQTALDINAKSYTQWSFGVIPKLKLVTEAQAERDNLRIWAKPGDYAGARVMGITFALSATMWFIWISSYLGLPGNLTLVKQRLLGLLAALILTVLTNLIFARMTTEFTSANSILGAAFGHLSIGLNAGGIWFITILARLGIGQYDSRPSIPASHMKDEKLSSLLIGLVIAFVFELCFRRFNLALPELSLDFAIWAVTIIAFFNYFGYLPTKWLKGERPIGIAVTICGTILSILAWIGIQSLSDGIFGAAVLTSKGSPGFSLMLSFWLLFWLTVSNQSGKTSPIKTR